MRRERFARWSHDNEQHFTHISISEQNVSPVRYVVRPKSSSNLLHITCKITYRLPIFLFLWYGNFESQHGEWIGMMEFRRYRLSTAPWQISRFLHSASRTEGNSRYFQCDKYTTPSTEIWILPQGGKRCLLGSTAFIKLTSFFNCMANSNQIKLIKYPSLVCLLHSNVKSKLTNRLPKRIRKVLFCVFVQHFVL